MTDENLSPVADTPLQWRPDLARVLVIDDCPESRNRLRFVLEADGLDVIEARDGLAGLQRAVEDAPDLVVIAAALQGFDGIEIAQRLSDEQATLDLPVFVSSSPESLVGWLVVLDGTVGAGARLAS